MWKKLRKIKYTLMFVRTMYKILVSKEKGWIAFNLPEEQQRNILEGKESTIKIHFTEIDDRVIKLISDRICG